ncbi:putative drug exporter of the RND superfamily [Actinomadura madurae]|uniref:Putative drug exporter of the RND superfamily n=1 Tax=Actinomadura madurae TaxID=1993 RepID=A0A1I5FG57_9ACTN|nr:MMPL family transporter [Actinomadura madurae]SFO22682.1 putative drug exporter of the RND superfamily [Actinomadura madurae]
MERNLAAALGGWSARHRMTAILGWLLFVVLASVLGGAAGQVTMEDHEQGTGQSARAVQILTDAGVEDPDHETVLLSGVAADSPEMRRAVAAVRANVSATGVITELRPDVTSKDRRHVIVQFTVKETPDDPLPAIRGAVEKAQRDNPSVRIGEFGGATADAWFDKALGDDFHRAEMTAVPLALGILLVAFGALLAAVLPVVLAFTAFLAAGGLLAFTSHALHVDQTTNSVMLLMGLAVGVDYCLFYLQREREERRRGSDREAALAIAAATSGRSVLVSGLAVMVAMSGMFLSGLLLFKAMAIATILVVFIAMLGSVTVLPALLSLLGDKVDFGRIRLPGRREGRAGLVGTMLRPVLARPGIAAVLSAGLLLALAAPALGMKTERLRVDQQIPPGEEIAQTYTRLNQAFPGNPEPAVVVVKARDIDAPRVQAAIADLKRRAVASGEMNEPIDVTVHGRENIAEIEVPLAGTGSDAASKHALGTLRERIVPQTVGKVGEAPVTGQLAWSVDYNDRLKSSIVPVFLFVMGITFLLMLVFFRSLPIALCSIVLNLLSVVAAYGVMVAVFQHGWGDGLVGTKGAGALESWIPLFVFVVLFGLSMDYHVFVVSRIREAYDRGLDTTRAVREGIGATAGVVTGAAVIMIATFGIFGTLSMQDFKQLGVGLAVAVLIDATVVRVVLLPAVMSLLGRANWYLPRWLGWLPGVTHGEDPAPAPEPLVPQT